MHQRVDRPGESYEAMDGKKRPWLSLDDADSLWLMIVTCVASLCMLCSSCWREVVMRWRPGYMWCEVVFIRGQYNCNFSGIAYIPFTMTWNKSREDSEWRALCTRSVSSLHHCLSRYPCCESYERGCRPIPKDSWNWPMPFWWSDYVRPGWIWYEDVCLHGQYIC